MKTEHIEVSYNSGDFEAKTISVEETHDIFKYAKIILK